MENLMDTLTQKDMLAQQGIKTYASPLSRPSSLLEWMVRLGADTRFPGIIIPSDEKTVSYNGKDILYLKGVGCDGDIYSLVIGEIAASPFHSVRYVKPITGPQRIEITEMLRTHYVTNISFWE